MEVASNIFEVVYEDGTAVVAPLCDLGELDHDEVESGCRLLEEEFRQQTWSNIVIDCQKTDHLSCSTIGFFVRLWRMTKSHSGTFALCGLSPFAFEILQAAKLDSLWPIYSSRAEAIEAVSNATTGFHSEPIEEERR